MVKIIQSRTKAVDVIIFPVPVQGTGAAAQMADMLDHVNENFYDIDTLIIGRGGGSAEDLWPFNEEVLARAIFRSRIPVISAVGHEIDFPSATLLQISGRKHPLLRPKKPFQMTVRSSGPLIHTDLSSTLL